MDRSTCEAGGAASRVHRLGARPVKVLKFGGTSVGSAGRLRSVVAIVRDAAASHRVVVVASAAAGVTDGLLTAFEAVASGTVAVETVVEGFEARHHALAVDLLSPSGLFTYEAVLAARLEALGRSLHRVAAEGPTPARRDAVAACGERMLVPLLALALREAGLDAEPEDAAGLILTDGCHGEAGVQEEETRSRLRNWHAGVAEQRVPVVTGFIGATEDGVTTTLGRSGSDYSASLVAAAVGAEVLERWTDVDGLYTEDPRTSKAARRLASIVLEEAAAWTRAGRLGLHTRALDPLVAAGIAVHVRATDRPGRPGTLVLPAGHRLACAATG